MTIGNLLIILLIYTIVVVVVVGTYSYVFSKACGKSNEENKTQKTTQDHNQKTKT